VAGSVPERWAELSGAPLPPVYRLIWSTFTINVVLAIFNLIPVPPLDGSRILAGLLPSRLAERYAFLERNPVFVILAFAMLIGFAGRLLGAPVNFVLSGILRITGNG
jgi:Zn-dependent protease